MFGSVESRFGLVRFGRPHVEEEDKTAQPLQSTGEERTRGAKYYSLGETVIVPCSQNI
jgi:hypothetical protein